MFYYLVSSVFFNVRLYSMKDKFALREGFDFRMDDGNSSCWFTNWSGIGKLAAHVLYVDIHDLHMRVWDAYVDGAWTINLLYTSIPTTVTGRLNSHLADGYTRKGNLNGIYSTLTGLLLLNLAWRMLLELAMAAAPCSGEY